MAWCTFMVVMSPGVLWLRSGGCWCRWTSGKHEAMALVADATGERLVAPFTFGLDRPGLLGLAQVEDAERSRDGAHIEVGFEAAGHHHSPVTASEVLPPSWTLVELNPAHVTGSTRRYVTQRRGERRAPRRGAEDLGRRPFTSSTSRT